MLSNTLNAYKNVMSQYGLV